jgi:hypothetical protein
VDEWVIESRRFTHTLALTLTHALSYIVVVTHHIYTHTLTHTHMHSAYIVVILFCTPTRAIFACFALLLHALSGAIDLYDECKSESGVYDCV